MSNDQRAVGEIVWEQICPWLLLLRAFRVAVSFRVLVLSAVGVVVLFLGWSALGQLFSGSDDAAVKQWLEVRQVAPWQADDVADDVAGSGRIARLVQERIPLVGPWLLRGPVARFWFETFSPFTGLFALERSVVSYAYLLLGCLWTIAVWSLFGGAITRVAVLALARDEVLGLRAAVVESLRKWPAYFLSPILPLLGALLPIILLVPLGLLLRVDLAAVAVTAIGWPLVLLAGLYLAIVLVGLGLAWPLMLPTVSTERTDAFDALSRSYAYIYQRPLHLLFFALVVSVIGVLGALVVDVFCAGVVDFGAWAVSWSEGGRLTDPVRQASWLAGDQRAAAAGQIGDGPGSVAFRLITFWTGLVRTVQVGFRAGFFWSAATAIYLLLRRSVDATEIDEVAVDDAGAEELAELETG